MSARVNSPRAREPRRSTRGASLPLVLLLFLICAMASSIVLAAASAAAGRAAGLADSEQLYYSATSAARLFRDEIENSGAVTVVLSQRLAADGSADGAPTLALLRDDNNGSNTRVGPLDDCTLLERAALFALLADSVDKGENVSSIQSAQQWVTGLAGQWGEWVDDFDDVFPQRPFAKFTLRHAVPGLDAGDRAVLELPVRAEIDKEGNLRFCFFRPNANLSGNNDALLTLVCAGNYDAQRIEAQGDFDSALYDVQAIKVTWEPMEIEEGVGSYAP